MKLSPWEIEARFRRHAVRLTRQRVAIYAALVNDASHPTADELYRTVKRQHPMMSRNTVYCTLGALRQAGLVQEVNVGHEVARFDGNVTVHHHLICRVCGRIVDVMDEELNRLAISSRQAEGFHVLGYRIEFYGYCADCQQARPDVLEHCG
ncbi:MAG: transcriptional repressor [Nitrospira sp.]|nr:transcriptional repressor [Nitrospira sp.]